MNRAARHHLLALLERAATPLLRLTVPEATPLVDAALSAALGNLAAIVLWMPPASTIEIIGPKNLPRVVAGKGGRRRGVRDRLPPLRLVGATS